MSSDKAQVSSDEAQLVRWGCDRTLSSATGAGWLSKGVWVRFRSDGGKGFQAGMVLVGTMLRVPKL